LLFHSNLGSLANNRGNALTFLDYMTLFDAPIIFCLCA
jgi:hypothetical protein